MLIKKTCSFICFFSTGITVFASTNNKYNPLEEIIWTPVGYYGSVQDIGSPHYLDVVGHTNTFDPECPRSNGMAFDLPSVQIHETEHMLNCQIRKLGGISNYDIEGIYDNIGKGIIFTKPKTKVTDFAALIPIELRESPSPYQGYMVDQMQYSSLNNIGYLFNEWASYRSNIILNLELERAGIPEPDLNGHAANFSPHFFGFLAFGLHYLKTAEPMALNDKQLKATFALFAEYTWKLMHEALRSPVFGAKETIFGSRIEKMINFYKYSPKFEAVRKTLKEIYGEDWVTELMN